LHKLGYSRKKTYGYSQRDEQARAVFRTLLAGVAAEQLVYVDESGMDARDNYTKLIEDKGCDVWYLQHVPTASFSPAASLLANCLDGSESIPNNQVNTLNQSSQSGRLDLLAGDG
jgi:hypothetical protein